MKAGPSPTGVLLLVALGVACWSCESETAPGLEDSQADDGDDSASDDESSEADDSDDSASDDEPLEADDGDDPSSQLDAGKPGEEFDANLPRPPADGDESDEQSDADGATDQSDSDDSEEQPDAGQPAAGRDVFGTTKLYPTANGGREWDSRYWDGDAHDVPFGEADPADPTGLGNQRGDGSVRVEGDGTLRMTGNEPRIYFGTTEDHPWLNVEITAYHQRVEDSDIDYAGLVIGARSGVDGHGGNNCLANTYYARFRNDGDVDLEKELKHPDSEPTESKPIWSGEDPPYGKWIGMKFIVTNVHAGQHVRLQVFRDQTEGRDGGTWEPLVDYIDDGGWVAPHDCGYAPDLIITEGGGAVLIRNTEVTGQGALYKWVSIREVDPQP